jgi:hypothetical protein
VLYVDIPTLAEFRALAETRADVCLSLYVPTSPLTQEAAASRTALGNLAGTALAQVADAALGRGRGTRSARRSPRSATTTSSGATRRTAWPCWAPRTACAPSACPTA